MKFVALVLVVFVCTTDAVIDELITFLEPFQCGVMFHTGGHGINGLRRFSRLARKRYQQGALRLKGKARKKWVLVWREDVQLPDGTTQRIQRSTPVGWKDDLPTKSLARRAADVILATAGVNTVEYRPRTAVTFAEVADRWKAHQMIHLKEGSQRKAQDHLRAHLLPAFKDYPLDAISNMEVQSLVTRLHQRMGAHSVKNVLSTLGSICKAAKAWGFTPSPWRLDDLVLPKDRRPRNREEKAFTVPQVREILRRAPQPFRAIFALCALAALRGGEALGLKREDVDLDQGVIRVRWSVSPSRTLQSVKSTKAERTLPLAPSLVRVLKEHLDTTWTPNAAGLLFPTRTGRPMSHSKVVDKHLHPILNAMEIPTRGLHAFRHTATSLLIEEGVPLPLVQEIVGHAHVGTTLGIYAHVIRPEHRAAINRLGSMLFPDVTTQEGKVLVN